MKTRIVSWTGAMLLGIVLCTLQGCNSSDPMGKGTVEFQITDSPSDDPAVKGVFVTVADIKVDGKSVSGFSRETIDLKAWQDGSVKSLGSVQLDARSYSTLTLILDADADAIGTGPGCYVLTQDNTKFKLRNSGKIEIAISKGWSVLSNANTVLVMDFDLRKSIKPVADASVRYAFVGDDNLRAAVRLVAVDRAGAIYGNYAEQSASNSEKVIVYAYEKGSFNESAETHAQGADAVYFMNAIASAEVKNGYYKLAFLESGDYELHFASYTKASGSEQLSFHTMLVSHLTVNGSAWEFVSVKERATLNVSALITF